MSVAQRILQGESVSGLQREFQIKRSLLYRWRDAYRRDGAAGLQPVGRPSGIAKRPRSAPRSAGAAARRVAELERKVGQQALDIDFLQRAFKRVKESRRKNIDSGGTASTERFEP